MKPKPSQGKEKPDEAKEEAPDTLGGTGGDDADDRDIEPVVTDPDDRPAELGGEDDELI